MPTDNLTTEERQRELLRAAQGADTLGVSDELLVALYVINRGGFAEVSRMPLSIVTKVRELELVDEAGELDIVARALLELVARTRKVPRPYKTDSRSCFGLAWYANELDAEVVGFDGRRHTINGGFDHGRACGRDSSFDCYAGAARLFAVVLP